MRVEPYLECRAASPTAHVTNPRAELSGVGQNMDRGPQRGVEMCWEGQRSMGTRWRRVEKRRNMAEEGREAWEHVGGGQKGLMCMTTSLDALELKAHLEAKIDDEAILFSTPGFTNFLKAVVHITFLPNCMLCLGTVQYPPVSGGRVVGGKCIPFSFHHWMLPHFTKDDFSSEVLEDVMVYYGSVVHDPLGDLIQFMYKEMVGVTQGSLIYIVFCKKGPVMCQVFTGIQMVINYWLFHNGFSISNGDLLLD
ncbi:hypothetical protein F5J12DRAFT_784774 [Pisolithus orientalis]|uniref:uncharacterized protein n=1 Tax=Pisolithus orientalis TaxID=936130 RepID=UPI002224A3F2|nr:uncharacterized protein F5J12DRAFT_784774 [Pisolithus orientalis]KAI5998926.1 hypothetical protein F5J12DRAFT_784774 [Pisolithus orientalis]